MDNNLSLLGITKKAGLLDIGEEAVGAAARQGRARLIISALDASERSRRQAAGYALNYGAAYVVTDYTKEDFGLALGRGGTGMMAICDWGLAARFISALAERYPDRYGGLADEVRQGAERAAARREAGRRGKVMTGRRRNKK